MTLRLNNARILVPILTAFIFGLYPAAAQLSYDNGANATFVILVTTFFRAVTLIGFCIFTQKSWLPKKEELRPFIVGGFFQAMSILGIIASLVFLPGPVTIIIVFTHTIMLLLFMGWKGEIEVTTLAIVTTLLALLGVGLVVDLLHNIDNIKWIGVFLASFAAVAAMSRMYIFGKEVQQADPAVVGARMLTVAFLFLLFLLFFRVPVPPDSSTGYLGVLLCSLSLVLGSFGTFYGLALIGAFQFSLMLKLEPVFTALFSWLVIGDVLNAYQYFGIFLVLASLIAYQYISEKYVNSDG